MRALVIAVFLATAFGQKVAAPQKTAPNQGGGEFGTPPDNPNDGFGSAPQKTAPASVLPIDGGAKNAGGVVAPLPVAFPPPPEAPAPAAPENLRIEFLLTDLVSQQASLACFEALKNGRTPEEAAMMAAESSTFVTEAPPINVTTKEIALATGEALKEPLKNDCGIDVAPADPLEAVQTADSSGARLVIEYAATGAALVADILGEEPKEVGEIAAQLAAEAAATMGTSQEIAREAAMAAAAKAVEKGSPPGEPGAATRAQEAAEAAQNSSYFLVFVGAPAPIKEPEPLPAGTQPEQPTGPLPTAPLPVSGAAPTGAPVTLPGQAVQPTEPVGPLPASGEAATAPPTFSDQPFQTPAP